jgi:hypothetical protein
MSIVENLGFKKPATTVNLGPDQTSLIYIVVSQNEYLYLPLVSYSKQSMQHFIIAQNHETIIRKTIPGRRTLMMYERVSL